MRSFSGQTGKRVFFLHTPEFEPLKGLRNPESDRSKAEAFDNAVDVVELLLVPTDQAPNVRHL